MLTGDELRDAREAARMTQQQVADRIEVSMRSVGNWERSGAQPLPRHAEARVRAEFPGWFGTEPAVVLAAVSDAQLLAEIARRFERGRTTGEGSGGRGDAAPNTRAADGREEATPTGGPGTLSSTAPAWREAEEPERLAQAAAAEEGSPPADV